MKNIWFIRTDNDGHDHLDVTTDGKFIYSMHGVCGDMDYFTEHKDKVFPKLKLNYEELKKLVHLIKDQLITDGKLNPEEFGKQRCDLAIGYWLAIMEEGDVAFVRNKQQEVIVCKIVGYVSEVFFEKNGFFQRPVEVLGRLKKEVKYEQIWARTKSRKTIERNKDIEDRALVSKFLKTL